MAYSARPGEMRTKIRILAPVDKKDAAGYRNPGYENIYPDDREIRCKWVTGYGYEAVQASSLGLNDMATITLRYNPNITADCRIVKDGKIYDIIGAVNDVKGEHRWMEIRVNGRVRAK